MTLNLVTPLWRGVENLKRLAESIPDYSDIRWIVVKADSYVLDIDLSVYPNLHLISLNIEDSKDNVHIKVNAAIDYMQPGHFQGLDDDTLFCPNSYKVWKRYCAQYKMIMGSQELNTGGWRKGQVPIRGVTDGAQGIIDSAIVQRIRLGNQVADGCSDGTLLVNCWNECTDDTRLITDETVSYYNFQR